MKTLIKCPFCDFTSNTGGKWLTHYAHRKHLKERHPTNYALLITEEEEVLRKQSQIRKEYGPGAN